MANLEKGVKTEDNVFILSALEVEKYFNTEEELLRMPTEASGIYTGDTAYDWWWLRTHGTNTVDNYIMCTGEGEDEESMINQYGHCAIFEEGVCPAIWLDLSALGD